ncbi:MAG: carbohydrate kinase family protein [Bryobacteraceae bacterium]
MRTEPRALDVIVAGEANVDLILTGVPPLELDQEKLVRDMHLVLGGSSSITAHNLARLGARVGFVGIVGDDFFGRFVEEKLRSAGVDLSCFRKLRGAKTGLTVWHARGRRRAGVTYLGTIARLRAADVPSAYLATARHLHVGAYFLLANLQPQAPDLFRRAQRLGLTTSLDCNYDPSERWDSRLLETLRHTDIFFPNEDEARKITGARDTRSAARELARIVRIVAVKRGARGVLVACGDRLYRVPALKTRAVETTGAGDSFNAGFLARFLRGAPLEECAQAGVRAGARAVTRVGGTTAFEE